MAQAVVSALLQGVWPSGPTSHPLADAESRELSQDARVMQAVRSPPPRRSRPALALALCSASILLVSPGLSRANDPSSECTRRRSSAPPGAYGACRAQHECT